MSATHLLYSKFDAIGTQMSPLLAELERRAIAYPSDLQSLLEECQTTYLAARKSLLTPRLITEIKGLDPANSELIELVRMCKPQRTRHLQNLDASGLWLFATIVQGRVHALSAILQFWRG